MQTLKLFVLATVGVAVLCASASSAIAAPLDCAHITTMTLQWKCQHQHARGARLTFTHTKHANSTLMLSMGDAYEFGCHDLPLTGAAVVRIVVGSYDAPERWLLCAQDARAAGLRVLVGIQYDNAWTLGRIAYRFRSILGEYGPYAWAVAVGNEEELETTGTRPQSGADYARTWRHIEPIVASLVPRAIRVAGEAGPWGMQFLADAVAAGLPGAQALSAHVYPRTATLVPRRFAMLSRAARLQAWATEGLCGPSAWMSFGCRSARSLRKAGIVFASEWYASVKVPVRVGDVP